MICKTFERILHSRVGRHIANTTTVSHEVGWSRVCKGEKTTGKWKQARLVVSYEVKLVKARDGMFTDLRRINQI